MKTTFTPITDKSEGLTAMVSELLRKLSVRIIPEHPDINARKIVPGRINDFDSSLLGASLGINKR